jgi:hypothetical protein
LHAIPHAKRGAAPQDIELEPIRQQAAQLTAEASGSGPLDRRPAWMTSGATRSQRMVALITRWMVAVSFELTDPPPQSPFDDFNSRSDACLSIRILSFKSDGLIKIIGIEERGATFNLIVTVAK